MLQVEDGLKRLYSSDSVDKNLVLDFYRVGQKEPFLRLWESRYIMGESMKITESLSSSENIDFGSCESSQFELTLIDVDTVIKGSEIEVYQTLEGIYPSLDLYPSLDAYPAGYTMPLGKYIIQSATRQVNRRYLDIIALDYMCKFDVDVIDWYNTLAFPMPLRDFRASLCRHIGVVEYVPDYLPNDDLMVEKTIDTAELIGRDVLIACEQLNGVFGHFDRTGVLKHVTLQPNYCLMPALDLYPGTDLYPVLPGEMNEQVYDERIMQNLCRSCQFEEYTVQSIDKVQIRQEEGDIGAIYGGGENCYTVEGNFLAFGKTAEKLMEIARGIYGMVNGRQYIPYECNLKGLPYIEVGDSELIEAEQGDIVSYVVKRTLKGIYALKDTHSATGEEIRIQEHNVNTEIIQLKGKSAVIKRNVEEVSVNLKDLEAETEAQFKITAEEILAEVIRAQKEEEKLSASLKIQAGLIDLKVSKGEVSSQLSVETDKITLSSNRLIVDSTNFKLDGDGNATFSGDVRGADIYGSYIEGGYIYAPVIESNVFSTDDSEVWVGSFVVTQDKNGTFQSWDGTTGISVDGTNSTDAYLWAGLGNPMDYGLIVGTDNIMRTSNDLYIDAIVGETGWGSSWRSVKKNIIELWDAIEEIRNSGTEI